MQKKLANLRNNLHNYEIIGTVHENDPRLEQLTN